MDTIQFPYRSDGHLPILHTIEESGAWEEQNLNVEYDYFIGQYEAHDELADGTVDFVGGNHLTPFAERTRGDDWVYLGQTVKDVNHRLIVPEGSDVTSVSDLANKVVANQGGHPGLNTKLFLNQQGLDEDAGDFEFLYLDSSQDAKPKNDAVLDGDADAALVRPPTDLVARRAGLKVIDIDPLPMIRGTTISTTKGYVEDNPDVTERFIKGLLSGIAFFKNNREETIEIIQRTCGHDRELAAHIYESETEVLAPKLYPSPEAVANAYQQAIWKDEAAREVEPFELWDFRCLRNIVDSGFVDELYD